jgi:hypothetical protein
LRRRLHSAKPRQHSLGDFQLIELGSQLLAVGIKPREPLCDELALFSDIA